MCGIFGKLYLNQTQQSQKNLALSLCALKLLHHRGPDYIGHYANKQIFLGSTRLSIVDQTQRGNMPIQNEDNSIVGVINGEIYNYMQLKNTLKKHHRFRSESDTEVLIHMYEEMGLSCIKELKGMFAFAIWDKKRRSLIIARDRLGKKPIVYSFANNAFTFASELKSIIVDPDMRPCIEEKALDYFLYLNYIPAPLTIYKNIYKLEPGMSMTINLNGDCKKHSYWQINKSTQSPPSYQEAKENVTKKIIAAVEQRIPNSCSYGVHLSGGIDSSLITALMAQITGKIIHTFSIGFKDCLADESLFSRRVAQQYQTKHHEFVLDKNIVKDIPDASSCFDEPFADPSLLPTWKLCKESSKQVRVILNGDGGDELFGGYERYKQFYWRQFPFLHQIAQIYPQALTPHNKIGKYISDMKTTSDYEFYLSRLFTISLKNKDKLLRNNGKTNVLLSLKKFWKTDINSLERPLWFDISTYLPHDLLVKTDTLGMKYGEEIRSPLLDDDLFESAMQLPLKYKLDALNTKILLKDIAKTYLPNHILLRKKQGFIFPFEWLYEKENMVFIHQILFSQSKFFDYISKERVDWLFNHKEEEYGNAQALWQLILLQLWFLKQM